jgi:hypothetical protein
MMFPSWDDPVPSQKSGAWFLILKQAAWRLKFSGRQFNYCNSEIPRCYASFCLIDDTKTGFSSPILPKKKQCLLMVTSQMWLMIKPYILRLFLNHHLWLNSQGISVGNSWLFVVGLHPYSIPVIMEFTGL